MIQLGFYFDQTRCIGCYTCAVACKDWHDLEAGPANWLRVRSIEYGRFPELFLAFLSSPCYHCADPPCVKVCPVEAIIKREADGVVVVDDKCLGNQECHEPCLKACPYGAPQFGPEQNAKMQKCNFCLDRLEQGQQTICVEACPMYALDAGPLEELKDRYGEVLEAEGFTYSDRAKPSVIFKPKRYQPEKASLLTARSIKK